MQAFELEREGTSTRSLRPKQVNRGYVLSLLALVLGLGIAVTVALVLAFSETTADPRRTVRRAREILLAEMNGQRPVLESTYLFSKTVIETSQQIYGSLKDPAPGDHVLLLVGAAAKHEMATYTDLELLHVRRSCKQDQLYQDLLQGFKERMLQAKIYLQVMDSLHYQSPRIPRSCTPESLVKGGLFSLREGSGRLLLRAGWFAGSKTLFEEVRGNTSQTLDLSVAEAVNDPHWRGAQSEFQLSTKRDWSIRDVMIFDLYKHEFLFTFKNRIMGFNIRTNLEPWDIYDYIFLPLSDAVLFSAMVSMCPKPTDISDTGLPLQLPSVILMLHCLRAEQHFTSNFTNHMLLALNIAQRTRVLAQASNEPASDKVCFGCTVSGVYKVPGPKRKEVKMAFDVAECILSSLYANNFPPDGCL